MTAIIEGALNTATMTPSTSEDAVGSDPLDVQTLAANFDTLMANINKRTQQLAEQVYEHVQEKKQISDENLAAIEAKLQQFGGLLDKCNDLNTEIDKLEQLQLFTRDFNLRLQSLSDTLRRVKT